eukprot:gene6805-3574_t
MAFCGQNGVAVDGEAVNTAAYYSCITADSKDDGIR